MLQINYGNQQPLFITSSEYISDNDEELKRIINTLDKKFKSTSNKYEISLNQLQQSVQQSQQELMEHFKKVNQQDANVEVRSFYDEDDEEENDNETFQFRPDLLHKNKTRDIISRV